jgi:ferredoxin
METLVMEEFRRIPVSGNSSAGLRFILGRTKAGRRLERRPVFLPQACTGCRKCVDICPADAISPSPGNAREIILTDSKCIRCYCCAEACTDNAVEVRVKIFGV